MIDVAIVGAGLGGLSCAAFLARAGLKVLIAEQQDQVGGYASSFRRGPFEFDVSLHLVDGVGEGEPTHDVLCRLDVAHRIRWLTPKWQRAEIWPTYQLRVPVGWNEYLESIGEVFSSERRGVAVLGAIAASLESTPTSLGSPQFLRSIDLARHSAGALLDRHLSDRRLRAALDNWSFGWLGSGVDEISALHFLVPWYSYHARRPGYPIGGSHALALALAEVVRENGGSILTGVSVQRIVVDGGTARGVALTDGSMIDARAVVSNVSPQRTLFELIDGEISASFLDRVRRMGRSVSCLKLWIGLDSATELPVELSYDVYLCGEDSPTSDSRFDPERAPLSVVFPSALLEEPAPTMSVTMLVRAEIDQEAHQAVLIRRVAASILPELPNAIRVISVAGPSTFERYTGNPGGSIYGLDSRERSRLGHRTPIRGLYLTGAWTRFGAGVSSVLRSGMGAAGEILDARI